MAIQIVSAAIDAIGVYCIVGLIFAAWFVSKAAGRMDPDARGATRGFRMLIFPGTVALWPLLLWRIVRGCNDVPLERGPHRTALHRTAPQRTAPQSTGGDA